MDILSKIGSGVQGATLEQGNKEAKRLKFVDLFCGCGGTSLGLEMAGMEGLASVEFDAMACKTVLMSIMKTYCPMSVEMQKAFSTDGKIVQEVTDNGEIETIDVDIDNAGDSDVMPVESEVVADGDSVPDGLFNE